jgi:hypothetical protein
MAGMDKDYPEQLAAGLQPHSVRELYYWVARHGQPYNRAVDVSAQVEAMVEGLCANTSQGPGGRHGSRLKARLAAQGLRLPALEGDGTDEAADREYARLFLLRFAREMGERYGVEYAEPFYYLKQSDTSRIEQHVEEYVAQHAVPLR